MNIIISSQPKVAVLLASYRGLPWIDEQISSILQQKNVEVNLIVSDDASDDGTADYLQKKQLSNSITLLPSKKSGSASLNFFRLLRDLDPLQVDFIAFADQDDIWLPHKLDNAIKLIKQKKVDAYSSSVKAFWPDGRTQLINKAQPQTSYDYMFESAGPGCTFVLTQHLVLELKSFLVQHEQSCQKIAMHDWFIYAFARSKSYQWFIDPTPNMLYRQHHHNVLGANIGVGSIRKRIELLKEGWFTGQAIAIANSLGYASIWAIKRLKRLSFLDRCILALNAYQLRRRFRDKLAFSLLVFFVKKH